MPISLDTNDQIREADLQQPDKTPEEMRLQSYSIRNI